MHTCTVFKEFQVEHHGTATQSENRKLLIPQNLPCAPPCSQLLAPARHKRVLDFKDKNVSLICVCIPNQYCLVLQILKLLKN